MPNDITNYPSFFSVMANITASTPAISTPLWDSNTLTNILSPNNNIKTKKSIKLENDYYLIITNENKIYGGYVGLCEINAEQIAIIQLLDKNGDYSVQITLGVENFKFYKVADENIVKEFSKHKDGMQRLINKYEEFSEKDFDKIYNRLKNPPSRNNMLDNLIILEDL